MNFLLLVFFKTPLISQHTTEGAVRDTDLCNTGMKHIWASMPEQNPPCQPNIFTCLLQTDEGCDPSQAWPKSCIVTSAQYRFLKQFWLPSYSSTRLPKGPGTQLLTQNWPVSCEHRAQAGRAHIYLQRNRKILFCLGEAEERCCLHTQAGERNQLSNGEGPVEEQLQGNWTSLGWKLGECFCHHSNEILEQLPKRNTKVVSLILLQKGLCNMVG